MPGSRRTITAGWLAKAILAARTGDRQLALDKLRAMQGRYGDAALFQYAEIYAQLGMVDQALAELEKAYQARDPGLSYIRINPFPRSHPQPSAL
jgi:tetratricopeptide (TPR) repeat protein